MALAVLLFVLKGSARAESAVDALEHDLQDIKQSHQDATAQNIANFNTQTANGMQSADAALNLYETSNGPLPAGSAVQSAYDHETPHEREAREAADQARLVNLALVSQLHCGLLHYGGLLIVTPDQKGLHDEWVGWLKSAPQIFLQIQDDGIPQVRDLRRKTLKDSVISSALGFSNVWGDKEQGGWTVNEIPRLYRSEVLDPLRATPTADTLAAWDVYISLKAAMQPDQDKWNQVEHPSLMFDRGCDDYAVTPSMDKLQALVDIIKANPSHPKLDDMLSKMHDLVKDYKSRHPGEGSPDPSAVATTASGTTTPAADPNVKVTTIKDGDMTIITTTTNAAASTPPPAPSTPPAN
jgi:hypothetical protein